MRALIVLIITLNILHTGMALGQNEPSEAREQHEVSSKQGAHAASGAESVPEHLRDLLKDRQYEKAAHYISEVMPNYKDKGYLYFKLSQTELERRRHRESFEAFVKALDLLDPPDSRPSVDPDVERQLNVVSLIRVHKGYKVASLILQDMLERNRQSASILYEMSYLRANQQEINDFLVYYYHGYKLDPANPRALPGQALIRDITAAESVPKPGNCIWLEIAEYYYDNPKVWANVMLGLKKHKMLEDTKVAALVTESVPDDIRWMFYFHYYNMLEKEQAKQEAIRSVKSRAGKDWRFERVRRGLLLEVGLESEALEEVGPEPTDLYERIFYYDFLMAYYHGKQSQLDDKGLTAFRGLVSAVLEFVRPIVSSGQKQAEITDHLVHQVARIRIGKQDYRSAVELFESYEGDLSAANCEVVASLYLKLDNQKQAIKWLDKRMRRCLSSERKDAAHTVVRYSILADDFGTARQCLEYAEQQNLSGGVDDYRDLMNAEQTAGLSHHRIANVPGYVSISNEPPWRSVRLGTCARACVYSLVNFYGKSLTYSQVSKDIDKQAGEQALPLQSYDSYFGKTGFAAVYFAPEAKVAKEFVAAGRPLLLLRRILTAGVTLGHMSVLVAYDDRTEQFFLDDISGVAEGTISYGRLIDSEGLVLVCPADLTVEIVPESLREYVISPPWKKLAEKEYDRLVSAGPDLKYWTLRHNGRQCLGDDSRKAVKYFEEAMSIRENLDVFFYYDLIKACLIVKDIDKAHKYAKEAMKIEPKSLAVMKFWFEITRDTAIKKKQLNAAAAQSLLNMAVEMEKINPDWAPTYLLRGDLFFRGSMLQNALNSFHVYLEKYFGMDEAWQQKNERRREFAAKAIEICRKTMANQIE